MADKFAASLTSPPVFSLPAPRLHKFFDAHGYRMVHSLYGKHFNGFMGVAVAFPATHYDLAECDISVIADAKKWPRKPAEELAKPGFLTLVAQEIFGWCKAVGGECWQR